MPAIERLSSNTLIIKAPYLHLGNTFSCGQIFCWKKTSVHTWSGWIDDSPVTIQDTADGYGTFLLSYCPKQLTLQRIKEFFCLDLDPSQILRTFPANDPFLSEALSTAAGIVILRQHPWECLASFICSSQKQLPHIQNINAQLRALFGQQGRFPTAQSIAALNTSQLQRAGLGYRARYLHETACRIAAKPDWLQGLYSLPTSDLIAQLTTLPGVGQKIAHCVALFAYHRLEAFPVDVWVHRIVTQLYYPRLLRKPSPREIYAFGPSYFGPYCGVAQQILFHWLRTMQLEKRKQIFTRARKLQLPAAYRVLRHLRHTFNSHHKQRRAK